MEDINIKDLEVRKEIACGDINPPPGNCFYHHHSPEKIPGRKEDTATITAVSYTHLDVYKRQTRTPRPARASATITSVN